MKYSSQNHSATINTGQHNKTSDVNTMLDSEKLDKDNRLHYTVDNMVTIRHYSRGNQKLHWTVAMIMYTLVRPEQQ